MTDTMSETASAIDRLRTTLAGRVITPEDPDYDAFRQLVPGDIDLHPAAIARVVGAEDVAAVVTVARDSGIELAVRSGGHSPAGHGSTDGGIVIDVRDLDGIEIDVEGRTAWAGSGMTAGAYTTAVGAHGLATGFGDTGSVGLGGITLGGGAGYLGRKHGLTIDSLLACELVTADGHIRIVDEANDPDLFWAVRGGGGNLGVATRFQFRLHELPSMVGGMLILPATPETIAGFVAASDAAPDELSTIANVMPCPPMPFVPEAHHGEIVIFAIVCWAGETAAGEAAIAPLRALATPIADLVHEAPYPAIYFPEEEPEEGYHPMAVARTLFMDRVGLDDAATILRFLRDSDAALRVAQVRVLGGAIARVPADATAYAHRARRIMVNVATFYDGPDDRAARLAWVAEFAAAIEQGDGARYVNFIGPEGEAAVRAAYPGSTWRRLAALKARYDPTNLFHRNQNVPPDAEGPGA
ncbi:MAG TPA: FAD-binding oxidoreductase [Candidatus Limnocylindrales bacterium]